jgi:hypothetical protein
VRRTYDTLTARLDATPVVLPDGTEITGNLLRILTFEALYADAQFPDLAENWQLLLAATPGWPTRTAATRRQKRMLFQRGARLVSMRVRWSGLGRALCSRMCASSRSRAFR